MKTTFNTLFLCVMIAISVEAQSVFEQRHGEVVKIASGERDRSFSAITAKLKAGNDVPYAQIGRAHV